jgi:hypothetical protein
MIVIAPQGGCKKQIGQQLAEKKQMYEAIIKINQQETQTRLNNQMAEWRDNLKEFVAAPEELAGLTFDIGQIANDIKLDSFSIKPQGDRESQNVSNNKYVCENKINVDFKANFNKFAAFLNAMERHRPVIFVDKFAITRAGQDDLVNQVSIDLMVFVKKKQGS